MRLYLSVLFVPFFFPYLLGRGFGRESIYSFSSYMGGLDVCIMGERRV